MIQANELRIGNTIQWLHEEHETFHNVNAEIISRIEQYNKNPDDDIFSRGFWYAPIELTPEILEKYGLKHGMVEGVTRLRDAMDIDDDAEEGDTHYWDLRVPKNDKVEGLSTFNLVKFGDADITFSNQWLRVKLHSLHQLQNLYFVLTGEELIYTP